MGSKPAGDAAEGEEWKSISGERHRLSKLLSDLMDGSRILIFFQTKKDCNKITRQLRIDGWPALSIHGDKAQAERDYVLAEFKSGKSPIMAATGVAARGLDMMIYLNIRIR
ncbi:Alba DNA/RNA-binding protein [Zea mays]|uniref:Alba DNA/RNA-binding protein n=1 Tax=Zea mays TaxID=4577 RepID=A0A1D6HKI0_MAIZE|nr:Alba DNA/RNA-binding protein [Zea mays]